MRNETQFVSTLHGQLLISLIAVVLLVVTLPGLAQVSKQAEVAASEPGRETAAFNRGY